MIFSWLRDRRRRARAALPFPDEWAHYLATNVLDFATLSDDAQQRARAVVQIFVAEKHWEGCGGLTMTDEVRVTIAGHVAVLVSGLNKQYFDHVLSILVYPAAYVAPEVSTNTGGIVTVGDSARLGEAWYRGPVVFSWTDVIAGGRRLKHGNVVYHEFAHQLDMLNGRSADGTPPLDTAEQDRRWAATTDAEFRRLVHECTHRHHTLIDCYGTTNRAEFFAVTTEAFFTRPHAFKHRHPDLFTLMCEVYRQDPTTRFPEG